MKIEVLGSGCANCKALEAATGQALAQLGMDDPVEKVTDFPTIVSYGVMSTPALALDGEVKVAGRLPTVEELKRLLSEHSLSHLG
ncbi:MAG: thioredoxin family protein [Acidimicrobiia bacterium]